MLYVNTFVTQRFRVACMYPILEHVQCLYLGQNICTVFVFTTCKY
jgi:hypothetical protein